MNAFSSGFGSGRAWCALALVVATSPAALGAAAKPPAVARLLPERTLALVVVENVSRTLGGLSETSMGRLWADPEFQAFAEPMRAHLGMLLKDGAAKVRLALADVLPLLEGQLAVAIMKSPRAGGMPSVTPELAVILDVSDAAAAARLLDLVSAGFAAKGVAYRTIEDGGARFINMPMKDAPFEGNIVLAGGRLLATISPDAKLIRGMVAASRGAPPAATLAADADFETALERAGARRDVFAYLHVGRIAEALFEFARLNARPEEFTKAHLVFEALGLDGVRSVSLSSAIDPPGFRTGVFVHAPAPRRGIFTLLSEEPIRSRMLRAAPGGARGLLAWSVRPDRVPGLVRELAAAVGPNEAARAEDTMIAIEQQLAQLGDIGREGVLFVERANVEPVVEFSNAVLAIRAGERGAVEPLYRLLAGLVTVGAAEHGFVMRDETTPGGDLLRGIQLPLGFSPTVALSDDYIVAAPTREAVLRALARLSAKDGPGAEDMEPLVETRECREATARVGRPTFLYAYRCAWRTEDYAPIMALMPTIAGGVYGIAVAVKAPPEVLEFLGKINIPAMPSPELLARYSIPSVIVGRVDADGLSVFGWGPGLYPGGLGSSESATILAVPVIAAAIIVPRAIEDGIDEVFEGVGRVEDEPAVDVGPVDDLEW